MSAAEQAAQAPTPRGPRKNKFPVFADPKQRRLRAGGLLLLLVAACCLFWPSIRSEVPFYTKGEPREALVVQSIVEQGTLVLPLRNGSEIPSKPPLFHWLGAIASTMLGRVSELAVRLPSAVASLLILALTANAGYRLAGTAHGLLAATVLLTCEQWLASSTTARVDMVLAAAITVAMLSFLHAQRSGDRGVPTVFWAAAAIGVLAKGPVALVLPLLIVAAYLVLLRRSPGLSRRRLASAAIWLAIPALWYTLATVEGGRAFLDKLIFKENIHRFLDPDAVGAGHVHGSLYYLAALGGGMAPWSVLLPFVGLDLWRRRRHLAADGSLLLALWFSVTFAFYCAAGSKRGVYLLSAYPALALLTGRWLSDRFAEPRRATGASERALVRVANAAIALLATAAVLLAAQAITVPVLSLFRPFLSPSDAANLPALARSLAEHRAVVIAWTAATLALAWFFIRSNSKGHWPASFAVIVLLVVGTTATGALTLLRDLAAGQSLRAFVGSAQWPVVKSEPLYFYRMFDYGAVFYARRPIPRIEQLGGIELGQRTWFLAFASTVDGLRDEVERVAKDADRDRTIDFREVARYTYNENPGRDPLVLIRVSRGESNEQPS